MTRYRIEVGHMHEIKPGNIDGAIANEAGIDSQHIGRIYIFDDYSLVDLPEGMPKETFMHLKRVWVGKQQMNITRVDGGKASVKVKNSDFSSPEKPAGFGKKHNQEFKKSKPEDFKKDKSPEFRKHRDTDTHSGKKPDFKKTKSGEFSKSARPEFKAGSGKPAFGDKKKPRKPKP